MKVISIVDDDYGIMFNNRRVSKDSVLNEHIIKMLDGGKLWLSLYSKQLFGDYENIEVNQEFGFAGKDDFCFVEDSEIVSYEDMVDEVYLYKWNRKYPSDVKFPKDMLNDFKLEGSTDFAGSLNVSYRMSFNGRSLQVGSKERYFAIPFSGSTLP